MPVKCRYGLSLNAIILKGVNPLLILDHPDGVHTALTQTVLVLHEKKWEDLTEKSFINE